MLLQQEKQHVHEKEMQQQKLQQEKDLLLGENVVPLQKEVLQEENQRDELHAEEQREEDADLFLFLYLIRNVNEEFF